MDCTDASVEGKLVVLSKSPVEVPNSPLSATSRRAQPQKVFISKYLFNFPLELRNKIYECQLDNYIREFESEKGSCKYNIDIPNIRGYYRPYVAATKQLMRNPVFSRIERDNPTRELSDPWHGTVGVALPSLHPPLMTLGAKNPIRQEALAYYLRTKVAIELVSNECFTAFEEWTRRVPPVLLASMSVLHVSSITSECVVRPPPLAERPDRNYITRRSWFMGSDGSDLPAFRLELQNGGQSLVIKGHCSLAPCSVGEFTKALAGWRAGRHNETPFDGTDLVSMARCLRPVGYGWSFQAGALQFPQGLTALDPGAIGKCLEDWQVIPSSDLLTVGNKRYGEMTPKEVFGIELARVDAD